MISLSRVEAEEVKWLWKPYFPLGKISIIQGDPGEGKTSFVLMTLAKLSNEDINSIYVTAEDGIADTILPRLKRQGAKLENIVTLLTEPDNPLTFTDPRLADAIMSTHAKACVLDPIQAFLGADVNMNAANEIRPIMAYLGKMAEELECAFILVGHQNKGTQTKDIYKGLGSIDITAAARSVLVVSKNKRNQRQRLVEHIKSSLAQESKTAVYEFNEVGRLEYKGYYDSASQSAHDSARERCKAELYQYLKEAKRSANATLAYLEAKGFSSSTIDRARKDLKVISIRKGRDNELMLPHIQYDDGGARSPDDDAIFDEGEADDADMTE